MLDEQMKERNTWRKPVRIACCIAAALFLMVFFSVLSLRWINPPFTAFTLQEDWGELGAERYDLRGFWVSYEELPGHLKWAVIASEDQRFWDHSGLDFQAIEDAMDERGRGERERGASTITQQVAKNLYLWHGRSFFRKGLEAGLSIKIELLWSKERILEVYLNIAEFGPGLFGAGKASLELFGLPPVQLSPEAAARMAAVLPSPKRMRAEPPSPYAIERSQWILRQMTQLTGMNFLPEAEPNIPDFAVDPDPFPPNIEKDYWFQKFELEKKEPGDTIPPSDILIWDEVPDSLLQLEN